jgi:hypothetical protein
MSLTLNPNTPQVAVIGQPLCFEGSGIMSIPQEDPRSLLLAASGTNWIYGAPNSTFKKISGTNGIYPDCYPLTDELIYGRQPFTYRFSNVFFVTPGGANNNHSSFITVLDDQDRSYTLEVFKYCNATPGNCNSQWFMKVYVNGGSVLNKSVNQNENFAIVSDGITLKFQRESSQTWRNEFIMPLPETTSWRCGLAAAYVGNEMSYISLAKGTYQGSVPITWSAPLGGSLAGTTNNQCFTASVVGDYQVCIDSDFDEPLCVDVHASELEFEPTDFDCGGCVFTNQIVEFTSNGGLTGILTVLDDDDNPVGTVIDALTWQAPGHVVHVTATYTLGDDFVECDLNVIPTFEVINIEGDTILGMAPGETIKLETNYEYMGGTVRWENLDCPNLVSPDGYLTIPKNYRNGCFGAVDCYIRVRPVIFPGGVTCDNFDPEGITPVTLDFRVIVDPIFPTPEYGGPNWIKWKPETPDFRVITKTMEGGCVETHIRNRVPTQRWTVSYQGIRYDSGHVCEIPSCCDDPLGFVDGVDPNSKTAKMLDDFWMLVGGQYGFFTLVDPKTGYIWRRVRFEGTMERDHINWRTIQSRNFTLIWSPCCATEPAGGTCPHNTVREDTFPPSVPQNITAEATAWNKIFISWDASVDNIGIKRYEIQLDGGEIADAGTHPQYLHTGLGPTETHTYRARAIDTSNNPSPWSAATSATTLDRDITPPSEVIDVIATTLGPNDIHVTWEPNPEHEEVVGYKLLAGFYIIDTGLDTEYMDSGLDDCTYKEYYVRAYDAAGNASPWSRKTIYSVATTECGELLEGTDTVMEDADDVLESH